MVFMVNNNDTIYLTASKLAAARPLPDQTGSLNLQEEFMAFLSLDVSLLSDAYILKEIANLTHSRHLFPLTPYTRNAYSATFGP